ncbi:olfactory receptor 52P1-like [Gastrophryne carolinensis]
MSGDNQTFFQPQNFILIGIPGLELFEFWITIPMAMMYVLTVLGNGTLFAVIVHKETLHKPMYLFFSMLAISDIVTTTNIFPKIFCIFWFRANQISFSGCLTQLFFTHASSVVGSAILLGMAYDRYIAICYPLRYNTILTKSTIIKVGILALMRGSILVAPEPMLARRLSFCHNDIISHTYCEHMAVLKIACSNTRFNRVYGLMVAMSVILFDIFGVLLSYCAILRAVFKLSSKEARHKALNTCGSHVCVILIAYIPAMFSFLAHRFGRNIPHYVIIFFANLYILIPPMCNPLIYGVKNKEIQSSIVLIFRK